MTVLTFQPRTTTGKQREAIELKAELYKVDFDANAIAFTPEGAAYYRAWLGRFGFGLDEKNAIAFFEAVSFINREVAGLTSTALERKLQDATLSAQERTLWDLYLAGNAEGFAEHLRKMATAGGADIPAGVVVPLR
jgi:hypothetical protein